jgi:hypothetical protein
MRKQQTGTIYTLTDPRDGRIRYVGKTKQDPLERLAGHLASASNPAMRVWLNALAIQGITPRIDIVATPPLDRMDEEEQRQIRRHADAGHRLFNAPHYHRNIADLYQTASLTPAALKRDDVAVSKVDEYGHRVYGDIAAASAAGRITRWQAAGRVLLRMPAVAVVFLWHTLASIPPLRWAVKIALIAGFLWGPMGLDRLAKDKLLPHLPVQRGVGFWHDYLEQPALRFALFLIGGAVVTALATYSSVRESAGAKPRPSGTASRKNREQTDLVAAAAADLDRVTPGGVAHDLQRRMKQTGTG